MKGDLGDKNSYKGYVQPVTRPGISIQELKMMTAIRMSEANSVASNASNTRPATQIGNNWADATLIGVVGREPHAQYAYAVSTPSPLLPPAPPPQHYSVVGIGPGGGAPAGSRSTTANDPGYHGPREDEYKNLKSNGTSLYRQDSYGRPIRHHNPTTETAANIQHGLSVQELKSLTKRRLDREAGVESNIPAMRSEGYTPFQSEYSNSGYIVSGEEYSDRDTESLSSSASAGYSHSQLSESSRSSQIAALSLGRPARGVHTSQGRSVLDATLTQGVTVIGGIPVEIVSGSKLGRQKPFVSAVRPAAAASDDRSVGSLSHSIGSSDRGRTNSSGGGQYLERGGRTGRGRSSGRTASDSSSNHSISSSSTENSLRDQQFDSSGAHRLSYSNAKEFIPSSNHSSDRAFDSIGAVNQRFDNFGLNSAADAGNRGGTIQPPVVNTTSGNLLRKMLIVETTAPAPSVANTISPPISPAGYQSPRSPRSLRHRPQIPVDCPGAIRRRSLSDSLPYEVAEAVLGTPPGSPAVTMRKIFNPSIRTFGANDENSASRVSSPVAGSQASRQSNGGSKLTDAAPSAAVEHYNSSSSAKGYLSTYFGDINEPIISSGNVSNRESLSSLPEEELYEHRS